MRLFFLPAERRTVQDQDCNRAAPHWKLHLGDGRECANCHNVHPRVRHGANNTTLWPYPSGLWTEQCEFRFLPNPASQPQAACTYSCCFLLCLCWSPSFGLILCFREIHEKEQVDCFCPTSFPALEVCLLFFIFGVFRLPP